jgi:hypothetical protein
MRNHGEGNNSLFGDKVHAPKSSVRVRSGEGLVRVGEVVGGDDVAKLGTQQWRSPKTPVPLSKDGAHDEHRPVVGRPPSDTLNGNGKVEAWHRVVPHSNF